MADGGPGREKPQKKCGSGQVTGLDVEAARAPKEAGDTLPVLSFRRLVPQEREVTANFRNFFLDLNSAAV
jgi:hypothetical protein